MTQHYFKRLVVTNQPCFLKGTVSTHLFLGDYPKNDTCLQYKSVSTHCFCASCAEAKSHTQGLDLRTRCSQEQTFKTSSLCRTGEAAPTTLPPGCWALQLHKPPDEPGNWSKYTNWTGRDDWILLISFLLLAFKENLYKGSMC